MKKEKIHSFELCSSHKRFDRALLLIDFSTCLQHVKNCRARCKWTIKGYKDGTESFKGCLRFHLYGSWLERICFCPSLANVDEVFWGEGIMGKNKEDKSGVPQIVLIDDTGEHFGSQGSYCWNGVCVDYALPSMRVDLGEKLSLRRGMNVYFKVVGAVDPDQFHVTVFSRDKIVLNKAVDKRIKIELSRGTYFLNTKATWLGLGDSSNVFLIQVF